MGAVPQAWATALEALLAPLHTRDAHLAEQVRTWVLEGDGDHRALLGGVMGLATRGSLLYDVSTRAELRPMLDGLGALAPDVLGRFVALVTAADPVYFPQQSLPDRALQAFGRLVMWAYPSEHRSRGEIPFDIAFLERLCTAYQLPTTRLITDWVRENRWEGSHHGTLPAHRLRGYADYVRRHESDLRALLRTQGVLPRLDALELVLPLPDETVALFTTELAEAATCGAAKVRAAAEPLLTRCPRASEELRVIATTSKPDARACALRLLWRDGDEEQRAWCRERVEGDRSGAVRALLEDWMAQDAPREPDPAPAPVRFDWHEDVSPTDQQLLRAALARVLERPGTDENLSPDMLDQLFAALAAGRPQDLPAGADRHGNRLISELQRSEPRPTLGIAATLAVQHADADLLAGYRPGLSLQAVRLVNQFHAETSHPTLSELAAALDGLGVDGAVHVLAAWSHDSEWVAPLSGRSDAELAEFALLHLDTVLAQVAPTQRDYGIDRRAAHRMLAAVPRLPHRAVDELFGIALGSRKGERRAVQDLLDTTPGIVDRILPSLRDSRAEVRAESAAWLGRIADQAALAPIEQAFARERNDVALAAMLDALQRLGRPVEDYLRPEDLLTQARKALAKGLPAELAWFPWAQVPEVRWRSGDVVPPEIIQWFLVQAVKGKTAEPNALLRTYTSMFEPRTREQLGQLVLDAWIGHDTYVDPSTARREAESEASHLTWLFQRSPQSFGDHPLFGRTEQEILEAILPRHTRKPSGSASSSKGVLALAAACAGERAAPVVQRYLKQFQALRRTQGQALVAMLAWVDHPSATQLVLAVGSRFSSKSIQAEANKQAQALADRRGWTMTELADRSVPSAGFDADGVLDLPYGDRTFTARLLPDLSIELRSPESRVIKSLPQPRVSDDVETAKESKKALANGRRELKQVVELQTARLYEAMCTGRSWEADVWQRYVLGHPVMRHLAERLVWAVADPDGATILVRPLGDGTLSDVEDGEVTPPEGTVTIAHGSALSAADVQAWEQHLADYEVRPLFEQFGRAFSLPEDLRLQTELHDFEGSMLDAFTLRGAAARLGYTRGEAGDAATFTSYEKAFSDSGLRAVINFSGNQLPEENVQVALTWLSFQAGRSSVRLADVPPVLLAEAWHDMRTLAHSGTGKDEAWQSKVTF